MRGVAHFLVVAVCLLMFLVSPALAGEVTLSVAASLKDVVSELADTFARSNPGVRFVKNFGGSGSLAKQVENGVPADIFIPANLEWVDYLKSKRLLDGGSITIFARNTLVFAGKAANGVGGMKDLAKLERIAIGSPKSVPAGEYAMEALKRTGIDVQLRQKLVMGKDVRESLLYAERGEVDGAFVYRTDALTAKQAKILFSVPQNLYPPVVYPMALTAAGAKNIDARYFFDYLKSASAKRVLARYGFTLR